jgi:hypothetical protein
MGNERQEVLFTELAVGDRIQLETGRSTYLFTVTDLEDRRGMLVGGNVEREREAIFSGSIKPEHELWEGGVRLGARATFFLVVPFDVSGFSQVITSPIIRITLTHASASA